MFTSNVSRRYCKPIYIANISLVIIVLIAYIGNSRANETSTSEPLLQTEHIAKFCVEKCPNQVSSSIWQNVKRYGIFFIVKFGCCSLWVCFCLRQLKNGRYRSSLELVIFKQPKCKRIGTLVSPFYVVLIFHISFFVCVCSLMINECFHLKLVHHITFEIPPLLVIIYLPFESQLTQLDHTKL